MKKFAIAIGLLSITFSAGVQASDELLAVVKEEQQAFKDGDCDHVDSILDPDVVFYMNTRPANAEQVSRFCRTIKRPFGAGRGPIDDKLEAFQTSEDSGYTVRVFRWYDKNEQVVSEIVTKIWKKKEDGWKIVHFQSTVMPEKMPEG